MTLYSYIVAYDDGFAPNPFHGVCTVACCKPKIRKVAKRGDYIVGLGPSRSGNRVVFAMRVDETLEFEDYWHDERFHAKRPDRGAGGIQALGDNIYHRNEAGEWQQEPSNHSHKDGRQSQFHTRRDIGGENVLIGQDFIYWGADGPPLPANLSGLIVRRGHRSRSNDKLIPDFIDWFNSFEERGILASPTRGSLSPEQWET